MVTGQALINSGATENFIDYQTAIQRRLHTKDLWRPRKVYNVDGTENQGGIISKSYILQVHQGEQQICHTFFSICTNMDCLLYTNMDWLWYDDEDNTAIA
jgi:hypothetical protein